MFVEHRTDRGGNFSGFTISVGGAEAYSKRAEGVVMVGVRAVYGGGSGVKVVALEPLPDGFDEREAVETIAAHLSGRWLLDVLKGAG